MASSDQRSHTHNEQNNNPVCLVVGLRSMAYERRSLCVRAGEHTIIWYKYNGSVTRYYHLNKRERKRTFFSRWFYIKQYLYSVFACYEYPWKRVRRLHTHTPIHITTTEQSRYMAANDIDTICALLRHGIEEWTHECVWWKMNATMCSVFSVHTYIRTVVGICVLAALLLRWKFTAVELCAFGTPIRVYGSFFPRRVLNLNQFH